MNISNIFIILGGGFNNNFRGGLGGSMMDNRPIGGGIDIGMKTEEGEPTSPCPHWVENSLLMLYLNISKFVRKFFKRKEKHLIHKNKELLMVNMHHL